MSKDTIEISRLREKISNLKQNFSSSVGTIDTISASNIYVNNRIAIGTTPSSAKLHISGTFNEMLRMEAVDPWATFYQASNRKGWFGYGDSENTKVFAIVNEVSTGNIALMPATDGGNVGIGTTTPASTLDINGRVTIRGDRIFHSSSAYQTEFGPGAGIGDPNYYGYYTPSGKQMSFFANGGASKLVLSGTNVGIGTYTPSVKLHVYSGSTPEIATFESDPAKNDAFIRVKESSTKDVVLGSTSGTGFVGSATSTPFAIKTYNTNRVTLDTSGKVSIGTNAPTLFTDLELYKAGSLTEFAITSNGTPGASRISLYSDRSLTSEWRPAYIQSADNGNFTGRLDIYTNGTTSANKLGSVLAASFTNGNVGIGTTSPGYKLDIYGGTLGTALNNTVLGSRIQAMQPNPNAEYLQTFMIRNTDTGNSWTTADWFIERLVDSTQMGSIKFDSNRGISLCYNRIPRIRVSSTTPGSNNSSSVFFDAFSGSGQTTTTAQITANGEIIRSTSDGALKNNFELIKNSDALEAVNLMNPTYFIWKDQNRFGARRDIGLIAQDVRMIIPESVGNNPDGTLWLDYQKLVPISISAIKELKNQNDDLKRQLAEKDKQINDILLRLTELEKKI